MQSARLHNASYNKSNNNTLIHNAIRPTAQCILQQILQQYLEYEVLRFLCVLRLEQQSVVAPSPERQLDIRPMWWTAQRLVETILEIPFNEALCPEVTHRCC